MSTPTGAWFGSFELEVGAAGRWTIGPFDLWAARTEHEWRLASTHRNDSLDGTLAVEVPAATIEPPEGAELRRFGFRSTPQSVVLVPMLADRPFVVSPEEPFLLPPGEEITLFISSVLWVRVEAGDPATMLLEQPAARPSDTWFGPSTMDGELCYASKTKARTRLEDLLVRPHRAISAVDIRNRALTPLAVEKLRLPAPQMSVYATADGSLWTQAVTLERLDDDTMASIRLGKGPPAAAAQAVLLSGPRDADARGLLTRAFSELLGDGRVSWIG